MGATKWIFVRWDFKVHLVPAMKKRFIPITPAKNIISNITWWLLSITPWTTPFSNRSRTTPISAPYSPTTSSGDPTSATQQRRWIVCWASFKGTSATALLYASGTRTWHSFALWWSMEQSSGSPTWNRTSTRWNTSSEMRPVSSRETTDRSPLAVWGVSWPRTTSQHSSSDESRQDWSSSTSRVLSGF